MLQKLNERIKGFVAWFIIILIAITFTLFGIDYYMQSRAASTTKVTVNGEPISKEMFDEHYKRARYQRHNTQQLATQEEGNLRNAVLESIIVNTISLQAARKNGFMVSREQANTAILNIPQFQDKGHFSAERYQQAISGALFTPMSFLQEVQQGMILTQQRFAFMGTTFALPEEVNRFAKLYFQTRDYEYLEIPTAIFKTPAPTEQAINKYYQDHKKQFILPEQVVVAYIHLSVDEIKKSITISDEEIEQYYKDNTANFKTPAQWKVAHIFFAFPPNADQQAKEAVQQKANDVYQRLKLDPTQFNTLVHSISEDKISALNNGVLPWLKIGRTQFDKILPTLTQVNQISTPFKTSRGYEIFKLIEFEPSQLQSLGQVFPDIKEQLIDERAQAKYAQYIERLSDLSYQSPDSLDEIANGLNLAVAYSEPFARKGKKVGIASNKEVIKAAFSADVFKFANNSEPIQLKDNSVVVLRIHKYIPAKAQELAQVKNLIVAKLAKIAAMNQAQQFGEQILALPKDSQAQNTMLLEHKLSWQTVKAASRETTNTTAPINELAFNLAPGKSATQRLANGNYALVYLQNINYGNFAQLDREQQLSITQQMESSNGILDYSLYIKGLRNKAKIVGTFEQ